MVSPSLNKVGTVKKLLYLDNGFCKPGCKGRGLPGGSKAGRACSQYAGSPPLLSMSLYFMQAQKPKA